MGWCCTFQLSTWLDAVLLQTRKYRILFFLHWNKCSGFILPLEKYALVRHIRFEIFQCRIFFFHFRFLFLMNRLFVLFSFVVLCCGLPTTRTTQSYSIWIKSFVDPKFEKRNPSKNDDWYAIAFKSPVC